jgi:hypothetical protein
MGFLDEGLVEMVKKIRQVGERVELDGINDLDQESARHELTSIASDILEMRPFLIHNFNPSKTLIGFDNDFTLAWDWSTQFGIANIIGAESEREALGVLASKESDHLVKVDYGGRMLDPRRPWSTGEFGYHEPGFGLAESLYVLRLFHEKLWNFYNKIDLVAIRKVAKEPASVEDLPEEIAEQVFALSCQDITAKLAPAQPDSFNNRPHRRLAQLRFKTLISHLRKSFACDYSDGKGSEVKVFRNGTKLFTLGHHGQNPEVSALTIRRLLRRLEISEGDWLSSIYC